MPDARSSVSNQLLDCRSAWLVHNYSGDAAGLIQDQSIPNAWLKRSSNTPDSAAFCDAGQAFLSHGELLSRSAAVAAEFGRRGLRNGDRVLMSCSPSTQLVVAHLAALGSGLTVVPVNTAFTASELANIRIESNAELAIFDDPARISANDKSVVFLSELSLLPEPGMEQIDAFRQSIQRIGSDQPALLVFTSGTTGKPKGAQLSHGNLLASAEAIRHAWQWTASDTLLMSLPLFHMHGLGVGVHGTLIAAASAIIFPKFDENAILAACDPDSHKYLGKNAEIVRPTMLFGVPTMWLRIAKSPDVGALKSLRLCVSGSAPLSAELWETIRQASGAAIVERYGMTETAMNVSNPLLQAKKPGTVGLPLPGVELMLHDCGPDGIGEIVLRGPNVFAGYISASPEVMQSTFTADGWFRTGDLGKVDSEGYVSIVGRSKDLIISGGYNVYPIDVETVIRQHPAVSEVAVCGIPSTEWGESVAAFVILQEGCHSDSVESELAALCVEHLANYQRPKAFRFVDEFPRNALGKVLKAELASKL